MEKLANIPWGIVDNRLKDIGKEQKWLRETLGVSPATLSNWKVRGVPSAKAVLLSKALSMTTDSLLGTHDGSTIVTPEVHAPGFDKNVAPTGTGSRAIPVISAIQAGKMTEINEPYALGDGYATIYTDDDYSQWAFGLEIEGDSMQPVFQAGDRVIIEPDWVPRPGEYVAARNGRQEATFKKYRQRGSDATGNDIFELVPLNENYPTVRSDETPLVIIGVMAEHRIKARRR